jgi:ATP-dependent DNA helicase RecQ
MRPCGHCDFCAPEGATAQSYRAPDRDDLRHLLAILQALQGNGRSTGKLHTELAASALRGTPAAANRRAFDSLLDALSRAGLVAITSEQWTNPAGDLIHFKKAALTHEGREAAATGNLHLPDLRLAGTETSDPAKTRKRKAKSALSTKKAGVAGRDSESWAEPPRSSTPSRLGLGFDTASGPSPTVKLRRAARDESPGETLTPAQQVLDQRLRDWRKSESEKLGLPQFFVLGSSTLRSIVLIQPRTLAQLQTISGIGPEKAQRYGPGIIEACNSGN